MLIESHAYVISVAVVLISKNLNSMLSFQVLQSVISQFRIHVRIKIIDPCCQSGLVCVLIVLLN